jgi:hypothetical protein
VKRRFLLSVAVAVPGWSWAQKAVESAVIGVGSFELPIPGVYEYEKRDGVVFITSPSSDRTFTVGRLTGPPATPVAELAARTQKSWESFVKQERGKVVVPFKRVNVSEGLNIFSMASEFGESAALQYYVQFAVVANGEVAILSAEGAGSAAPVMAELEPKVMQVKVRR